MALAPSKAVIYIMTEMHKGECMHERPFDERGIVGKESWKGSEGFLRLHRK